MSGTNIRPNMLMPCCLRVLRVAGHRPRNWQVIDCTDTTCPNKMWYRDHAWEWFAVKRRFNRVAQRVRGS